MALLCPIDGLPLTGNDTIEKAAVETRARTDRVRVGEHVHTREVGPLTCANGHVWRGSAQIWTREA